MPDIAGVFGNANLSAAKATEIVDRCGRGIAVDRINKLDRLCVFDCPRAGERGHAKQVVSAATNCGKTFIESQCIRLAVALLDSADDASNTIGTLSGKRHTLAGIFSIWTLCSHAQSS
jgi:hypothetical protein